MKKYFIFDMDGLMVDTESLSVYAYKEAAKLQGQVIKLEDILKVMGFNKQEIYDFYKEYFKNRNIDSDKFVSDHYDIYNSIIFNEGPKKKYYIEEILAYIKEKNYKIAVASSSDKNVIINNLKKTNLLSYIDEIISGDMVKKAKPNPEIFLLAMNKIGGNKLETIIFEDSKNGVNAAYNAGIDVIFIKDLLIADDEIKSKAKLVLFNLEEAYNYLKLNIEK